MTWLMKMIMKIIIWIDLWLSITIYVETIMAARRMFCILFKNGSNKAQVKSVDIMIIIKLFNQLFNIMRPRQYNFDLGNWDVTVSSKILFHKLKHATIASHALHNAASF